MRILVLVAGTNEQSNSAVLADAFTEGMKCLTGLTVEKIRLKDVSIPHFALAHYKPDADQGADFARIGPAVMQADGVVIATPIWNFSVPAHLKNFIDHLGTLALDQETRTKGQLKGKPFFFLFTGGAPLPAWKGLMRFTTSHVSEGLRYMGATIVGRDFEGKCTAGKGVFTLVVDKRPETLERMRRKGEKFARFVERFMKTRKLPLYYRMFAKAYLFGQRVMAKL